MTDVIRPANGQAANAQSSGNAWQDPHGTPGYDAAMGERTLVASESGEARAWPKRPGPGAERPAGWFLPTDGEAAPPFRSGLEPARSDERTWSPSAGDDDRGGWRQESRPAAADPVRALWPWTFPTGSRQVPVVGPTEALRGRTGGAEVAVPPAAVAAVLDPAQRTSWQRAQEVWQESGVSWERTAPELADIDPADDWFPDTDEDPAPAAYEPAATSAWPAQADPEEPELARFESPAVGAWPAQAEPEDPESAVYEPPATSAWPTYAEPETPEPAGFEPSAAGAWSGYAEPEAAANGWSGYGEPEDPEPAGFEPPAAGARFADSGLEDVVPAETWFTGLGPADTRFTAVGNAHPGRADAWQPDPAWTEYPPDGFPGQTWPAGSGRLPLGAPVALDPEAPESAGLAGFDGDVSPGWVGGPSLTESDELFRAWQGSVNQAAAARGSWSVPRRGAAGSRRRRGLQAAAIGVPVAIIVTVGAGALMMLTGKANEMLAPRADTGTASPAATATGTAATPAGSRPTAGLVPPAFVSAALSGYPGQRGTVTVASIMVTAGATVAVGTADGHPAIWRRARNGSWPLVSAGRLSAVTGSAGLTSVAHGPAGWIAVGSTSAGGATEPVVLASADGVTWQPVATLAAQAGAGTEFLGAAAGSSGYVVVGRQMIGGRTFAVLWYSADLRSWAADSNDGLDGRLAASTVNAVAATSGGFVAVGSHGADQSLWISSDGRHWSLDYLSPPAGAASATLSSVAASGTQVVAGGYAATRAGDIPVIVVSADGGAHWRQVVLPAPDGLGLVTALTVAPHGFTAAGVAGRGGAQHAVTWTSPNGLTWSSPAQAAGSEITALALVGSTVAGTAEQGTTPTLVPVPAH